MTGWTYNWDHYEKIIQVLPKWLHITVLALSLLRSDHGGSLVNAITSLFPEFNLPICKFQHVPRRHWKSLTNQREYFDYVFKTLKLNNMQDWYKIKVADVKRVGNIELQYQCIYILTWFSWTRTASKIQRFSGKCINDSLSRAQLENMELW